MVRTCLKSLAIMSAALSLSACGSMPDYAPYPSTVQPGYTPKWSGMPSGQPPNSTPLPNGMLSDRVTYSQKDPRWGKDRLGRGGDRSPRTARRAGAEGRPGCLLVCVSLVRQPRVAIHVVSVGHPSARGVLHGVLLRSMGYLGSV